MSTRAALHARQANIGRSLLALILVMETVAFVTLVMVALYLRGQQDIGPLVEQTPQRLALPVLNLGVMLLSAGSAWWSYRAIRVGHPHDLLHGLLLTLTLGVVFVVLQVAEFSGAGMAPDDDAFGGVFFALMGFHALHVLAGLYALAANAVRARLGDFSASRHLAVELGTWFWYFVAGVWVVLFVTLYVL